MNTMVPDTTKQSAIHWPTRFLPGTTDNFTSNEIIASGLSASQIWAHLHELLPNHPTHLRPQPPARRHLPLQHLRLPRPRIARPGIRSARPRASRENRLERGAGGWRRRSRGGVSCVACGGSGGGEGADFDAGEPDWEAREGVGGEEAEYDAVGASGLVGWVGC
jgi:hypothetical protein